MANANRNLSLASRDEETRESRPVVVPVQFSLVEIRAHFTDSMNEIKKQYQVADSLNANGDRIACQTIWRSQVVLAEGLLDFYIHEMSKYCLFRMFSGSWDKSDKYERFPVPMAKVEEAIATTESRDWFFEYLNERFSRDVFLSLESMRDQLNMIGLGFVDVLVKAFPDNNPQKSKEYGKTVIKELFERRNAIAHQNDRSHASAEQADISKEFVEDYIRKIESIVNAIHELTEEKDAKVLAGIQHQASQNDRA